VASGSSNSEVGAAAVLLGDSEVGATTAVCLGESEVKDAILVRE